MKPTSLNFGALKETIARKASVELVRGHEGNTLALFMESLRKSVPLKKQHLLYKSIETVKPFSKERLAERFLNQNLDLIGGIGWHEIISENKNLRKDILGAPDESTVFSSKGELHEAISTLIESRTNKAFTNFEKENKAFELVMEHLTREEEKNEEQNYHPKLNEAWSFIAKNAVSNFNKRYSHLSEDEKKLFRILVSEGEQKKNYIKSLKEEIGNEIKRKMDESESVEERNMLQLFEGKISKEVSDEVLIGDDYIFNLSELGLTLKGI